LIFIPRTHSHSGDSKTIGNIFIMADGG